jgi:peptidoglycan/LPS O-acetylase OafA/YrhL
MPEPLQGPSPLAKRDHIPALDGLRGVACMMILSGHFLTQNRQSVPPALLTAFSQYWSGVDLFFVLSGFVIFLSLDRLAARSCDGPGLGRSYLTSRAFRILPVYILFLSAFFWIPRLHPALATDELFLSSIPRYIYLFFGQSWYMALRQRGGAEFVDASWSLCAEVFLYALSFLIVRFLSKGNRMKAMLAAVAASYAARLAILMFTGNLLAAYLLPVCRMDSFMAGGIVAVLYADGSLKRAPSRKLDALLLVLFCVFATLSACAMHFAGAFSILFSYAFYSVFYSAILVRLLNGKFPALSKGPLAYVGTVSYFIYLFHFPIVYAMRRLSETLHCGVFLNLSLTLAATVGAASLSWYALERPMIALGRSLIGRDTR